MEVCQVVSYLDGYKRRSKARHRELTLTEHPMELPVEEKDEEKVMRIPKPLKMFAASPPYRKEHHNEKDCGHDPTSDTWSCCEIGF